MPKILWGGGAIKFYSGPGSHNDIYVNPYCETIKKFLLEHSDIKRVIDLGCGDFNVASKIINDNIDYIGIDIVQDVITSHQKTYSNEHVHFQCLDIVEDELPDGDACMIRQVLQHLSNDDIAKILLKTKKYKYVLVTEHRMSKSEALSFNIDIQTGSYTRCVAFSGVYLEEPPFNLKTEMILQLPSDSRTEFVTLLIEN